MPRERDDARLERGRDLADLGARRSELGAILGRGEERLEGAFACAHRIQHGPSPLRRGRERSLRRTLQRRGEEHERRRAVLHCEAPRYELVERRLGVDVFIGRRQRVGMRVRPSLRGEEDERCGRRLAERIGRATCARALAVTGEHGVGDRVQGRLPTDRLGPLLVRSAHSREREDRHLPG